MQSSSPSLAPSLPDVFSGFNNSLRWFSPRRHRCNNPGHHWKASSMCAEEISAVAPQTQICDAVSHWVQITFILHVCSRAGCRVAGAASESPPCSSSSSSSVHAQSIVRLSYHSCWFAFAEAGRLLQWWGSCMSLEVQPFRGQSMSSWLRAWWEKT